MWETVLVALTSFAVTGLVVKLAAARAWAFDTRCGPQHFHDQPASRLGGAALALVLAGALFSTLDASLAVLWLACIAPAFVAGLADDLTGGFGAWPRLALTLGGAALAWSLLDAQVVRLGAPLLDVALQAPLWSLAVTVLCVGGAPHALNLIDGYNGLAGLYALLTLGALALVSAVVGDAPLASIALAGAACVAGFLAWNFPRGRIFLGDGGAYLLGSLIALVAVKLVHAHPQVSPMFAALLLVYPAFETLFSIWRKRLHRGRPAMQPDGLHLHMLLHKRLARTMQRGASASVPEGVWRNSATTLYALPLVVSPAGIAVVFWADSGMLTLGFWAFCAGYIALYRRLVRFRMPAVLRLRAVDTAWAAKQVSSADATSSRENARAMRSLPAAPSRTRSIASPSSWSIARVSAAASPRGTSRPVDSVTSSGVPPTAVAITGSPDAMASISATGMPSCSLASTTPSISRRR